jgi:hypothetical protein
LAKETELKRTKGDKYEQGNGRQERKRKERVRARGVNRTKGGRIRKQRRYF